MGFRDALNSGSDDLTPFDQAPGGDDLANFDAATGETFIPAGWYSATIVRGEVVTTKKQKQAYRLSFDVADGPHRGFRLWRYFTFDNAANANRAKVQLAPLGLTTSAALRAPFPGPNRVITLKILVGVQKRPDGTPSNDVERFEVTDDRTAPPNPNAVNLEDYAGDEGGTR
ncbi:MAG: hypothetical protein JWO38_5756 [Gemmataceae bacterium]|nr:hypothetical protein [Gemmataceae bacterium]